MKFVLLLLLAIVAVQNVYCGGGLDNLLPSGGTLNRVVHLIGIDGDDGTCMPKCKDPVADDLECTDANTCPPFDFAFAQTNKGKFVFPCQVEEEDDDDDGDD